jgi:hypothetical protein
MLEYEQMSASVPRMGQTKSYLTELAWDDNLTLEQRMDSGPFQSGFGRGQADRAPEALNRARAAAEAANAVLRQVKEQAVYALLEEGNVPIRGIAVHTGIPKSEVGRIARALGKDPEGYDGKPASHGTLAPHDLTEQVRDGVRAAWGYQ